MTEGDQLKPLTDHYIQLEILVKLADSERPVRFTSLKNPAIENSLFMYHANKLIRRGLVDKLDAGFALTQKGADWINFVGTDSMLPHRSPRPYIQLYHANEHGEVLLARRKGSLKDLLNEYMLPGGLYKYGMSLDENCQRIATKYGCHVANMSLVTIAETIDRTKQGLYHSIVYVYCVQGSLGINSPADDNYEHVRIAKDKITPDNGLFIRSKFLPEFIKRYATGLRPNELFRIG